MENIIIILLIIEIILIITSPFICILIMNKISNKKIEKSVKDYEEMFNYTDRVLSFIRNIVSDITVIRYREFKNNHALELTTKPNVSSLISDVANESRNALHQNFKDITSDKILVTDQYLDEYLVQTALINVQNVVEKDINEMKNERMLDEM